MAIAKVENVDLDATAVVMNPTDAWSMFTKRAAGGSGTFDAGTVFSLGQPRVLTVWGLPVLRSRAYASGSALVGDFQRGAMILDREETNVQVYPQHSDYAARNQVLVQCEERIGLIIPRPDAFVVATMS
jgi:HK97 family phage major capsid protein